MAGSDYEWLQFYQQNVNGDAADATVVTNGTSDSILSPARTNSCSTSDQLNPKGCVSKPVRRRSRVSKKTPTTLLNATANNFRSLVQQFTGCPSTASFSFGSSKNIKGPVNLSFGLGNDQNQRFSASVTPPPPFSNNYYYQPQQLQQQEQHQAQFYQQQQQQKCLVSFDQTVNNEGLFGSSTDNPRANSVEIPEGFNMDDMPFNDGYFL